MKKICVVVGTRPEAIKMAPVVRELERHSDRLSVILCSTGQHKQMLDQVLSLFDINPDFDLGVMQSGQDLTDVTSKVLLGLRDVFKKITPDLVLVHGDTTTAFSAAVAAFYERVPIGHVEAGLRTGDKYSPWPEEMNRKLVGALADYHFAPTDNARSNLEREGVDPVKISTTGNTVIDALAHVVNRLECDLELREALEKEFSYLNKAKKLVLVTGHRRENFGDGFEKICCALKTIAQRDDVEIVYPVHLNPNVREPVERLLSSVTSIHLVDPLDYLPFVYLMNRSYLVLTDSGGIQEEAPSLGKPVLVMRNTTERPEGIAAGTVRLVGADEEAIVAGVCALLDDSVAYESMASSINPYGDGFSSRRIVDLILAAQQ